MWTDQSIFYQIYPMGAFGAPFENDGILEHRILKMKDWMDDLNDLGIDCLLFNPMVQSHTHGYDTIDYYQIDCRLGTSEDVQEIIEQLHKRDIKVLFDGVFNHVGRGFFAFQDVLKNRHQSPYKDWFYINFEDNNSMNDGLSYQNWEGNEPLVKLNLQNPEVRNYLLDVIGFWMDTFQIDGIRFDVAYSLDHQFLKEVRSFCKSRNPEFFLLGETLHGDYNVWMNESMLDSCTNYECYKGLYSSFNSKNFFEICHSLNRQFGQDPWCLYTGKQLFNFVDNHDVVRIASQLEDKNHIPLIYAMLLTMPGMPCLYYGSEWGIEGEKNWNDTNLRPEVEKLQSNELTQWIKRLIDIKHKESSFHQSSFRQIGLTNTACVYERGNCWVAINMEANPCAIYCQEGGQFIDLLTQDRVDIQNELSLNGYQVRILKRI